MHYDIAKQLKPAHRPDINKLVDDCIHLMADQYVERMDSRLILSGDKSAIDKHVRGLIDSLISADCVKFADLLKQHLLDELVYRLVARSYFD